MPSILAAALAALACLGAPARGAGDRFVRRPGDPPRARAHSFTEYRHITFFSKEYQDWVAENIKAQEYAVEAAAFTHKWDALTRPIPDDTQEVVIVTQTSVSRLTNFAHMASVWGGPVSVAVFVDYAAGSEGAAACKASIHRFFADFAADVDTPVALSFLHARASAARGACDVPRYEPSIARSARRLRADTADSADGAPGGLLGLDRLAPALSTAAHPRRALHRSHAGGASRYDDDPRGFTFKRDKEDNLSFTDRPLLDVYSEMYPINNLRNLAFELVPRGAFVLLLDCDFTPTPELYPKLVSGVLRERLADARDAFVSRAGERRTFILPAFELNERSGVGSIASAVAECGEEGIARHNRLPVPRTFDALRCMIQARAVDVFHRRKFPAGHMCYSWLTWLQHSEPATPLRIDYVNPCEPYVIALSDAMPRYDERYRGRGMNKVEQLTHMAMWGFEWEVLPAEFVLHLPHKSEPVASEEYGGDVNMVPRVLMKVQAAEVQHEPEFRQKVQLEVPLAVV